jgi:RNA polymerase sigma-70 factor (ECF subfamily)
MTPVLAPRSRPDRSFERLYQRYVGDVFRYALAVMRNQADAEDVTQTTFLNAYRAFQRGERPEKPQNWLIAIAHNVCRQRFRQSARRPAEVAFEDDVADQLVQDEDAPTGEDIRRALGQLAFNQRAALVMRELEGRSYAEIAEILDLSTSAVETLIFRARRALREQLETSLTCGEAELAISRQLDGRLSRQEKAALRAHLRQCRECAGFARRQRAQRTALRSLAAVPLPASLSSFFGGTAAVGTAVAMKAAVALTVGAVVGAGAYEGVRHGPWRGSEKPAAATQPAAQDRAPDVRAPTPREHLPIGAVTKPRPARAHGQPRGRGATAAAAASRGRAHAKAAAAALHGQRKAHGHAKPSNGGGAGTAARHAHARPAHARPAHARPAHARPAHARPQRTMPVRTRPVQTRPTAPSHPVHPTHPSRPPQGKATPTSKPPKPTQPASQDAGPPPDGGNGKKPDK